MKNNEVTLEPDIDSADINEGENFLNIFNIFFKEHEKWLSHIVNGFISDYDDAQDITQKTWLSVSEKLNEYNPKKAGPRTWIYSKILKGKILHYFREQKKRESRFVNQIILVDDEEIEFLENLPADSITPDESIENYQKNWLIRKTLKKLPPNYQDVIILHYFGSLELIDVSKVMKKNENTIRIWHFRAKEKLFKPFKKLFRKN